MGGVCPGCSSEGFGQSFQSWLVRLPVRERGMGLRSLVDTIPAAFIGLLRCLSLSSLERKASARSWNLGLVSSSLRMLAEEGNSFSTQAVGQGESSLECWNML